MPILRDNDGRVWITPTAHDWENLRRAKQRYPAIYVVYRNPRDFLGWFVVRACYGPFKEPVGCLCETLEEARASVPYGSVMLARHPDDDPVILETWI